MKLVKKILGRLNGLHYRQEYLCASRAGIPGELHASLVRKDGVLTEINEQHCFIGYSPLVFALFSIPALEFMQEVELLFSSQRVPESGKPSAIVARLYLHRIAEKQAGSQRIYFYEAHKGIHRFTSWFSKLVVGLENQWFQKKTGNVFLRGNLYSQVQIAYSLPRRICLITVGKEENYNLFPTDLHGPVGNGYYLISLRHEGRASRQVEETGKLLLSDMDAAMYTTVYALGKNHMQPMKEAACFPFSNERSGNFDLPLPSGWIGYREMEVLDGFIHGIHRIFLFRVRNDHPPVENSRTLVHIHNVYATWRHKKGLQSNYLLR